MVCFLLDAGETDHLAQVTVPYQAAVGRGPHGLRRIVVSPAVASGGQREFLQYRGRLARVVVYHVQVGGPGYGPVIVRHEVDVYVPVVALIVLVEDDAPVRICARHPIHGLAALAEGVHIEYVERSPRSPFHYEFAADVDVSAPVVYHEIGSDPHFRESIGECLLHTARPIDRYRCHRRAFAIAAIEQALAVCRQIYGILMVGEPPVIEIALVQFQIESRLRARAYVH